MPDTPRWIKYAPWLCASLLGLHLLGPRLFPAHALSISYFFQILTPLLALAAALNHLARPVCRMRIHWALISLAIFLWTVGVSLAGWAEVHGLVGGTTSLISNFIYFIYGVPVLLAISAPRDGKSSRLFLSLEATQAILAGILAYMVLFSVLPFEGKPVAAISDDLLARIFHIENIGLAATATLRLFSCRKGSHQRAFYSILSAFLWTYALLIGTYNYFDVYLPQITRTPGSPLDLTVDIPFLLLAFLTLRLSMHRAAFPAQPTPERIHQTTLEMYLDNGSAIFFTLAILALGVHIAQTHFVLGIGGVVAALLSYASRAIVLQSRYAHAQQELQEARDRLEKLSLQDGLTGVANRRSFDQTLLRDWNLAARSLQPLSLILIDVDFFKRLNDNYGHLWGDECLTLIAQTLQTAVPRSSDLLARFGGEEFAAILPATDHLGALVIAERMAAAIAGLRLPNPTEIGEFVSISIGTATHTHTSASSPIQLIEAADQSLYKAKQSGRNRTESLVL
jgi:diguanylate cyclase (GGDEF)-like protein